MADDHEEPPTSPGTPNALRMRQRNSGTWEPVDPESAKACFRRVAEELAAGQIRILQERLALAEAQIATLTARVHTLEDAREEREARPAAAAVSETVTRSPRDPR
jgi:hypothetical protein